MVAKKPTKKPIEKKEEIPEPKPDYPILERFMAQQNIDIKEVMDLLRNKNLDKFLKKYKISEPDLESILKSARAREPRSRKLYLSGPSKHFKYGYFSDPHIGHKQFKYKLWDKMIRYFKREKPDFILTPGDHLEGMSHRVGHVYNLELIGYHEQIGRAVDLYNQLPVQTFGIDGNHDMWYFRPQNMGVVVGEDLERRVKKYTNLGQQEGDLEPVPGLLIKLFHANDGTAYAVSYKLQKLIESFTGGEKPDIVHSGHYHKALSMVVRNVMGFECGTLCGQTEWMRGRKIAAHMGFGMVDVYYNRKGVDRIIHEWVPYYESFPVKNKNINKG